MPSSRTFLYLKSNSFDPKPRTTLYIKYHRRRANAIVKELTAHGYDIDAEQSKFHSFGTVFVFPHTRSMSDLYWYRLEIITVIVSALLWLIVTWVFPYRYASPITEVVLDPCYQYHFSLPQRGQILDHRRCLGRVFILCLFRICS